MRVALYHPRHGYYGPGAERTGRRGHFMTSSELDPAFGELWARGVEQVWDACGRPGRFDLIEVGPGEGGLARGLLAAAGGGFARALRAILVEPSGPRRARQQELLDGFDVEWAEAIEDVGPRPAGCLIANEVLDNQPVHVLRRNGEVVEELHVTAQGTDLRETWLTCSDPGAGQLALENAGADGRFEISPEREHLVRACVAVLDRGAAIFIDYGRPNVGDTLASYSGAGVTDLRLDEPGLWDITAYVDWDAVARACSAEEATVWGPVEQRDVLLALGAASYDKDLRGTHARALERGDGAGAVRSLSRRHALRALLDPGGLGGLEVVVALKKIAPPPFAKEKDRPEGRSL